MQSIISAPWFYGKMATKTWGHKYNTHPVRVALYDIWYKVFLLKIFRNYLLIKFLFIVCYGLERLRKSSTNRTSLNLWIFKLNQ